MSISGGFRKTILVLQFGLSVYYQSLRLIVVHSDVLKMTVDNSLDGVEMVLITAQGGGADCHFEGSAAELQSLAELAFPFDFPPI